jgi:hypothetical protein
MKAIRTTCHGPTDNRGSRVKATDGDGHTITLSRNTAERLEDVERDAAERLARSLCWDGVWIAGSFGNARYWVTTADIKHKEDYFKITREEANRERERQQIAEFRKKHSAHWRDSGSRPR